MGTELNERALGNVLAKLVEGKGVVVSSTSNAPGTTLTVTNSLLQITEAFWFQGGTGLTNHLQMAHSSIQGRSRRQDG